MTQRSQVACRSLRACLRLSGCLQEAPLASCKACCAASVPEGFPSDPTTTEAAPMAPITPAAISTTGFDQLVADGEPLSAAFSTHRVQSQRAMVEHDPLPVSKLHPFSFLTWFLTRKGRLPVSMKLKVPRELRLSALTPWSPQTRETQGPSITISRRAPHGRRRLLFLSALRRIPVPGIARRSQPPSGLAHRNSRATTPSP